MPLSPDLETIVFPATDPYADGFLQVSDLHRIYWQAYGNKDGIPVVCLHGGPGSGMSSWHPRLFDLSKYHVILFDQRGCGRSEPFAALEDNTTAHLISDMEQLRRHFRLEDWYLFGGSWGSTLALAYADHAPQQVRGLIIYGIFLARSKEFNALLRADGPPALLYPEYYDAFISLLPPEDRAAPIEGYQKLFASSDDALRTQALRAWSHWEMRMLTLVPEEELFLPENEDLAFLETHSKFEQHYYKHNGYIDGDRLLQTIGAKLSGKPVHIVQGRYDLICPAQTAYELHNAIPHSTLTFAPTSGHSGKNPEIMQILKDRVADLR